MNMNDVGDGVPLYVTRVRCSDEHLEAKGNPPPCVNNREGAKLSRAHVCAGAI